MRGAPGFAPSGSRGAKAGLRTGSLRMRSCFSGACFLRVGASFAARASLSTPPGFTQRRVEHVEIGLDLFAIALVDQFPSPYAPRVGQSHPSRRELALDVVDPFAEHDLDPVGPLAVYDDVQGLPGFRYAHLDLLRGHL